VLPSSQLKAALVTIITGLPQKCRGTTDQDFAPESVSSLPDTQGTTSSHRIVPHPNSASSLHGTQVPSFRYSLAALQDCYSIN
jgi:hypothetical protein